MKKTCLSFLLILGFAFPLLSQEVWGLERCIREALEKNLTIQQQMLSKSGYEISGKQLRRERIPRLNFGTDFGFSVGRVINPSTNDFETENALYQSMGFSSGLLLYNGGRLNKSIRQNDLYLEASEKDIQQAEEDIALNVASAYLNILFAYENLAIAEDRVELTRRQLETTERRIAAGAAPENDRYDILSQVAIDEQRLISAQNDLDINMLNLKQLMYMEQDYPLQIERPVLNLDAQEAFENQPFDSVYSIALSNLPSIQAAEIREVASELDVDIARTNRIPTLSIGGNLGTNWSNLTEAPTGYLIQRFSQPGVYINGEAAQFEYDTEVPTGTEPVPYIDQLDNNIGYGWSASLSIPILNHYANQASVEQAKINLLNASIEKEQAKELLKTNIQNALAVAKASRKSMESAQLSADAARIALENAESRTAVGSLSNYDYLTVRNLYDAAQNNLLIAQFD